MPDLRLGMIGSGFMGLTYSEAIANFVEHAELAGVAGGKRAASLAQDYGVPAFSSVQELLEQSDVDAVVVATPDQNRLEITQQAAAAGKHLLVEKPMAPSVEQCRQMIDICQRAGIHLGVVKTERYRKVTNRAKQYIDKGTLGPLRMLRTTSAFPINVTQQLFDERPWMADPAGGGLFMGMASHNTDFLRWLTGKEVRQVFAQCGTFSDIDATPLSVMAQLVFEDGIMAHLFISAELPAPSWPSSEVRFEIIGRDAMLDLENFEFLKLGQGETWEQVYTPERFDYLNEPKSPIRLYPHAQVIQDFVDSVRNNQSPPVGGAEGLAAVEICEACLLSARTGEVVHLRE